MSNFKIEQPKDFVGGSLFGYMRANYKDLKKLLGNPSDGDGYKVDAEWSIIINGKGINIYNYKDGKNYNGKDGLPKTKITDWHIGAEEDVTEEVNFLAKKLNTSFRKNY